MNTRRHTSTLVVATLAGTLALGACGAQRTMSDAAAQAAAPDAQAQDAEAESRAAAVELQELRKQFPTAGTEVPPADLFATAAPAGHSGVTLVVGNHPTLRHVE